MPVFEKT